MKILSNSPKETQKIASDLAHKIIKTKKGAVIALEGELGAGKTTFIQGFAKALGIRSKIKSPTFVLMKKYPLSQNIKREVLKKAFAQNRTFKASMAQNKFLYHLDCYRVRDYKDLRVLELKEIFKASHNIVIIEWAERVREILPKKHITVHIDHISENTRKLLITNF